MFDLISAQIDSLSVHYIGAKASGETSYYARDPYDLSDAAMAETMLRFFTSDFKTPEYFSITDPRADQNYLYDCISNIFEHPDNLVEISRRLAEGLYEASAEYSGMGAYFFVSLLRDISINGEKTDAIGLIRAECRTPYLKPGIAKKQVDIELALGIVPEKPEKACLILNQYKEQGFKILLIDKGNKSQEDSFWKDRFLSLKPFEDPFHQTRNFLEMAKTFVSEKLPEEFEVTRADQIDYLNRSINYFKENDNFSDEDFSKNVFNSPELIQSFQEYKTAYENERDVEFSEEFQISAPAVKKQARIFKSVLKLDRNFHIYIHGNREMIEKGVEQDGRKFYKIYYEEEN